MLAQRQEATAAGVRAAEVAAGVEVAGGTVTRAGERAVAEAEHRLREAQAALREAASEREAIEAAREKAEAGKAAAEAECRGLEAALVQLMARAERESHWRPAAAGMRRLVVAEAEPGGVDAATQTEAAAEVSVSSQTESEPEAAGRVCEMQPTGHEMVVGRQLHPAQAEAVERAKRAAEQLERLREQAEAAAARYCVAGGVADAQAAEVAAQKTAQVTTPTGGRQRRRAQMRRQAAAAGVDVLSWTVGRRRWQEEAEVDSRSEVQRVLEQRLDAAHEQWLWRQRHELAGDAYVGEAEASRRFWQAAQASGINLLDAPV